MSRPEHLSCVNTAEGIRRINEEQEYYDIDPEAYERQEREQYEQRQEEERQEREQYEQRQEEERQMQEYFARFTPEQDLPF